MNKIKILFFYIYLQFVLKDYSLRWTRYEQYRLNHTNKINVKNITWRMTKQIQQCDGWKNHIGWVTILRGGKIDFEVTIYSVFKWKIW